MKFTNTTDWYYGHLYTFAVKAALHEEVPAEVRKKIRVIFRPRRGKPTTYAKCYISPGTSTIEIGVPKKDVDKDYMARLLCWSMACMRRYARKTAGRITNPPLPGHLPWAVNLPLEKAALKAVLPSRAAEKKLTTARNMVKVWARKAKLADTILHKWHRRVKFYETRLASPPKLKAPRTHFDQKLMDAIAAHDGSAA